MKTRIVIGLGFGDEGKGLTTAFLSKEPKSLVVRFSGGHQAGHTVVKDGFRHVFAQFGSGTLHGAATYYSKHCTFSPVAFMAELERLSKGGFKPEVYVDRLCPVTTFYDVFFNRALEKYNSHGSVGVGFAATVERNESPVKLFAQDLTHPGMLERKLIEIRNYYDQKIKLLPPAIWRQYESFHENNHLNDFLASAADCQKHMGLVTEADILNSGSYENIVFEGSQGVMLDMDHGVFPNVTRSNTTSKNAMRMIREYSLGKPDVYYVTRAYVTRHGNGWMPNESYMKDLQVEEYPQETNVRSEWQGSLRKSILDINTINYALQVDSSYFEGKSRFIVVTCIDQVKKFQVTLDGKLYDIEDVGDLVSMLDITPEHVYFSSSPEPDKLDTAILVKEPELSN